MAECTPCQQRRDKLKEAREKEGVKGVIKALPAVVVDTIKRPPGAFIRGGRAHV